MEEILPGYTRVSEILSIFQAYAHVDRAKLKKAQDIGTLVHGAIEKYFQGHFVPLFGNLTPYFDSFLNWAEGKGKGLKPLFIEERLYDHELMITGRIDLLCEWDGAIVLVDFKTGSWAHPEIWKLQATFYRELLKKNNYKSLPDHYVYIQLKPDGSEPLFWFMPVDVEDLIMAQGALRAYRWFEKQKTPLDRRGN